MPRFEYKCTSCNEEVIVTHDSGVAGYEGCPVCGSGKELVRLFSSFTVNKKTTGENKPGTLVKSHIEEAKEELRKEKDKLSKKDFKV